MKFFNEKRKDNLCLIILGILIVSIFILYWKKVEAKVSPKVPAEVKVITTPFVKPIIDRYTFYPSPLDLQLMP